MIFNPSPAGMERLHHNAQMIDECVSSQDMATGSAKLAPGKMGASILEHLVLDPYQPAREPPTLPGIHIHKNLVPNSGAKIAKNEVLHKCNTHTSSQHICSSL